MSFTLSCKTTNIAGAVQLTGSKSESNRALIIQSLCHENLVIANLSEAQDTVTLKKLLHDLPKVVNCGPAGTTLRFLAARLCLAPGEFILTGTARMKERPVGILVDALRNLGASIEYTEKEGFPPLKITGGTIVGGQTTIDGSVSSQFISALCLIAPALPKGLVLDFVGEIASKPYLEMTLAIMAHFGVKHAWNNSSLSIQPQTYLGKSFTVEPDWSAASYWYAAVALSQSAEIKLPNLKKNSLQGDAVVATLFEDFGVSTEFLPDGIVLRKKSNFQPPQHISIDCERCPDLAQTFATTIAGLDISGELRGLKSLHIKETDRITALICELAKFSIKAIEKGNFVLAIEAGQLKKPIQTLTTYEDHRMAMAFAPLVLKVGELSFDHPEVVNKSYPGFWRDFGLSLNPSPMERDF